MSYIHTSELLKIFKAAWTNFLAISVSNNFHLIILKSYRLFPINTCRISLFSKINYLKWIKILSLLEHEKSNQRASCECLVNETVWLRLLIDFAFNLHSHISCIDCKHNKLHSDTQVLNLDLQNWNMARRDEMTLYPIM